MKDKIITLISVLGITIGLMSLFFALVLICVWNGCFEPLFSKHTDFEEDDSLYQAIINGEPDIDQIKIF